jgi:hypothetical protein
MNPQPDGLALKKCKGKTMVGHDDGHWGFLSIVLVQEEGQVGVMLRDDKQVVPSHSIVGATNSRDPQPPHSKVCTLAWGSLDCFNCKCFLAPQRLTS